MTNSEIMKADLLDILFDKRNKDYGAYAIRRGYNHRLLIALGSALSVIFLLAGIHSLGKKEILPVPVSRNDRIVEIKEIRMPVEKPKEKPEATHLQVKKTASEKFVSRIVIKPDDKVKEKLPDMKSLDGKLISDKKEVGKIDDRIPPEKEKLAEKATGIAEIPQPEQPGFRAHEKEPEFPGGPEALKRFLAKTLSTPSNLEDGEKKTVQIRFKVNEDGTVNTFEIIASGGNEFDNEVVRVCKKMPRWIPALQNGINIPVSYVLPVTFIGSEQ